MQPYRTMFAHCGVTHSMSRMGGCLDKAVIESLFGTLKAEYFHLAKIEAIEELKADVDDYVDCYNNERSKLKLKGLSPVEYQLASSA